MNKQLIIFKFITILFFSCSDDTKNLCEHCEELFYRWEACGNNFNYGHQRCILIQEEMERVCDSIGELNLQCLYTVDTQKLKIQTWLELGDIALFDSLARIDRFQIPGGRFAFLSTEGKTVLVISAPLDLDFDVAAGEVRVEGPEVLLPEAGTWNVRLHIHPAATDDGLRRSVIVNGTWDAERDHGEPSPLPWRPGDAETTGPVHFVWSSTATAVVDLDSFLLDAESGGLVVHMPLEAWVVSVLEPTLRSRFAHEEHDSGEHPEEHTPDLPGTEPGPGTILEDDGLGLSKLFEHVSANFLSGPTR